MIELYIGGCRSGKSTAALQRANRMGADRKVQIKAETHPRRVCRVRDGLQLLLRRPLQPAMEPDLSRMSLAECPRGGRDHAADAL